MGGGDERRDMKGRGEEGIKVRPGQIMKKTKRTRGGNERLRWEAKERRRGRNRTRTMKGKRFVQEGSKWSGRLIEKEPERREDKNCSRSWGRKKRAVADRRGERRRKERKML